MTAVFSPCPPLHSNPNGLVVLRSGSNSFHSVAEFRGRKGEIPTSPLTASSLFISAQTLSYSRFSGTSTFSFPRSDMLLLSPSFFFSSLVVFASFRSPREIYFLHSLLIPYRFLALLPFFSLFPSFLPAFNSFRLSYFPRFSPFFSPFFFVSQFISQRILFPLTVLS